MRKIITLVGLFVIATMTGWAANITFSTTPGGYIIKKAPDGTVISTTSLGSNATVSIYLEALEGFSVDGVVPVSSNTSNATVGETPTPTLIGDKLVDVYVVTSHNNGGGAVATISATAKAVITPTFTPGENVTGFTHYNADGGTISVPTNIAEGTAVYFTIEFADGYELNDLTPTYEEVSIGEEAIDVYKVTTVKGVPIEATAKKIVFAVELPTNIPAAEDASITQEAPVPYGEDYILTVTLLEGDDRLNFDRYKGFEIVRNEDKEIIYSSPDFDSNHKATYKIEDITSASDLLDWSGYTIKLVKNEFTITFVDGKLADDAAPADYDEVGYGDAVNLGSPKTGWEYFYYPTDGDPEDAIAVPTEIIEGEENLVFEVTENLTIISQRIKYAVTLNSHESVNYLEVNDKAAVSPYEYEISFEDEFTFTFEAVDGFEGEPTITGTTVTPTLDNGVYTITIASIEEDTDISITFAQAAAPLFHTMTMTAGNNFTYAGYASTNKTNGQGKGQFKELTGDAIEVVAGNDVVTVGAGLFYLFRVEAEDNFALSKVMANGVEIFPLTSGYSTGWYCIPSVNANAIITVETSEADPTGPTDPDEDILGLPYSVNFTFDPANAYDVMPTYYMIPNSGTEALIEEYDATKKKQDAYLLDGVPFIFKNNVQFKFSFELKEGYQVIDKDDIQVQQSHGAIGVLDEKDGVYTYTSTGLSDMSTSGVTFAITGAYIPVAFVGNNGLTLAAEGDEWETNADGNYLVASGENFNFTIGNIPSGRTVIVTKSKAGVQSTMTPVEGVYTLENVKEAGWTITASLKAIDNTGGGTTTPTQHYDVNIKAGEGLWIDGIYPDRTFHFQPGSSFSFVLSLKEGYKGTPTVEIEGGKATVTPQADGTWKVTIANATDETTVKVFLPGYTNNEELISGVSVYPLDRQYICIEAASRVNALIVDMLGRIVYNGTVSQRELVSLHAGLYIVVITDQNSRMTVKVML